ncbi:MAG: conjugative transposon protein TraM [Segetibacter sp.]
MKSVLVSQAVLRKLKLMLVVPLLVIPFLTMAFWALGGGQAGQTTISANEPGLNLNLPDAGWKNDDPSNKMSFYEQSDKDSMKLEEMMRNDPYYKKGEDTTRPFAGDLQQLTQRTASKHNQQLNTSPYEGAERNPEQKLIQKLALLERELARQPEAKAQDPSENYPAVQDDGFAGEVDRLQNMMETSNKPADEDPEMKQLSGTLEKILDIQHPERVKERIKEKSLKHKQIVFAVSKQVAKSNISLFDTSKRGKVPGSGFYGIDDDAAVEDNNNAIEAVVHANQVLVNGAVIKLRLATDIYVNGTLIPKDNFVFGTASLNGERLEIEINSIRNGKALFPVKLEVYDMDGLLGIYIPGAITRDVAKRSADNGLSLMDVSSMDPSLKAQAAATGINAAKSLLSKRLKQVKVTVKAGYKVLLKDKNMQQ